MLQIAAITVEASPLRFVPTRRFAAYYLQLWDTLTGGSRRLAIQADSEVRRATQTRRSGPRNPQNPGVPGETLESPAILESRLSRPRARCRARAFDGAREGG